MASKFAAAFCLLMATFVTGQIEVQPQQAVIVRGGNVSMICKVAYPIDSCRIRVAGVTHILSPSRQDPGSNLQYNGHGFSAGECGVVIKSVDEAMNGNITCSIPSQSSSAEIEGVMQLIIAKAPERPELTLSPGSSSPNIYLAGERLKAVCTVAHGRPRASISWFLGDQQLLEGLHAVVPIDEPNSDLQTVSQNLTRVLQVDDDGKALVCKAEHQALSSPYIAQRQLTVQYPPQRLEAGPITIFGVKLREDGTLNVTVRANPLPRVARWSIGDIRLSVGEEDHEGKFRALHLQPLGQGWMIVSLLIRNVEKVDVDRQYLLTVANDHGSEEFVVRISTSDEPEAVQLDAGSIVGIVVGVLVLLVAASLLVFARATHRWCFADSGETGESHARSSGESSDTESAVAGPKSERRRLPDLSRALPALRSVLPSRGRKDKVAETQPEVKPAEEEEKPLQEGEKKSVVYAELALANPAVPAPKPSPEATEYAEIVYGAPAAEPQVKNE